MLPLVYVNLTVIPSLFCGLSLTNESLTGSCILEVMQLSDTITTSFRLVESQKKALGRLGLTTVTDLLYHAPHRYENIEDIKAISGLSVGDEAIVYGTFSGLTTRKTWKSRRAIAEGWLNDGTGRVKVMWFNQPYLAKMVTEGQPMKVTGVVGGRDGKIYLANPEVERASEIPATDQSLFVVDGDTAEQTLFAIYAESKGITSKWFRHALDKVFMAGVLDEITDPIPEAILKRYKLPSLKTALIFIHQPKRLEDAEAARKRFAFQEIFLIQLAKQQERASSERADTFTIDIDPKHIKTFTDRFPFALTKGQASAIKSIFKDFTDAGAMSRLLEGDVGSGKTAVAATTAFAVVESAPASNKSARLQVGYMAPTEILAKQHFESFIEYFHHLPVGIGLLTGSGCQKFPSKTDPTQPTNISKAQLLKWIKEGDIHILIGTHALIQKTVEFRNLGYIIIDEQHRFGTGQRRALRRKIHDRKGINADFTRTDAETDSTLLYKDLTYKIRRIIFEVKKELGLGHKEVVYQQALEKAFTDEGLKVDREVQIPITYRNKKVGVYIPDFVIEGKVVVELKALKYVGTQEKKQLLTYLKGSEYKLGLLVNFGHKDVTVDRIVYDTARSSASVREGSASSPHESALLPHLLSMTATPIPRTLALTLYGDLDITVLDEMPKGRKPIQSFDIKESERPKAYDHIHEELKAGRQAYVICPRIDEPDPEKLMAVQAASAIETQKKLQSGPFSDYSVGLVHSKMSPKEKDSAMLAFAEHKTDILVATSVVEVGVNVPNATIIMIEGAERFGLAQLHQLRGRVMRSSHQAYCYFVNAGKSQKSKDRLKALTTAKNGFELAEFDLKQRGAGELYGRSQSGLSDLGMEALKNLKLVEAAREEAKALIAQDLELSDYPELADAIQKKRETLHFE